MGVLCVAVCRQLEPSDEPASSGSVWLQQEIKHLEGDKHRRENKQWVRFLTQLIRTQESGPCLLSPELGSVCTVGFVGTGEAGDTFVGFVVANSSTYCNMSARGYLVGPEP